MTKILVVDDNELNLELTREVLELAQREHCPPRDAAEKLAASRVKRAMALRRWGHSN